MTWTGGGNDGLGTTAKNWSSNQVPGANDDVVFDNTSDTDADLTGIQAVKSISLNFGYTHQVTIPGFGQSLTTTGIDNMTSGTLSGSLTVSSGGTLNWTAGTITGAPYQDYTTISANAILSMTTGNDKVLDANSIENYGTITWQSPGGFTNLRLKGDAQVFNESGSFFKAQNPGGNQGNFLSVHTDDESFTDFVVRTGATFSEDPVLGVSFYDTRFESSGTLDINGTLSLAGPATLGGTATVAQNATLQLAPNSTYTQTLSGLTETGLGLVTYASQDGNVLLLDGTNSVATFQQGGNNNPGNISGAGDLNVTGTYTWLQGDWSGMGMIHILPNATMNIAGGLDTLSMTEDRVLVNDGTVAWQSGTLLVGGGAVTNRITNNAGAIFEMNADFGLEFNNQDEPETFLNYGTLVRSAGFATVTIEMHLSNYGNYQVTSGALVWKY